VKGLFLRAVGRIFITLLGAVIGYELSLLGVPLVLELLRIKETEVYDVIGITLGTVIITIIFYLFSSYLIRKIRKLLNWVQLDLEKVPTQDIIAGAIGLIIGLIIANLLTIPFSQLPIVGQYLPIITSLLIGYLGMNLAIQKREELYNFFGLFPRWVGKIAPSGKERMGKYDVKAQPKILDTSVIIDGRIADICKTGFVEGVLVIPNFVLEELRHIADSPDVLRRNRGRRGLDILNIIQSELDIPVHIYEGDFEDVPEVDSKLIKLAKQLDGMIFTNDFNLNKVAVLQGIRVLNINEVANAFKPVVLPGEEMEVNIVKEGKEAGQGLAYLDDGTMIVVDGGKRHVGGVIEVVVTSVLQTAAGRMIFAKPRVSDKVLSVK